MAEVHTEVQRVLAPHLTAMRKDLKEGWPELDPELLLLHWLCSRNGVKAPSGSLMCKPAKRFAPPRKAEEAQSDGYNKLPIISPNMMPPKSPSQRSGAMTERASSGSDTLSLQKNSALAVSARAIVASDASLGLRTLGVVSQQMELDKHHTTGNLDIMKRNAEHLSGVIANMRQDLRGKFVNKVPLLSIDVLTTEEQQMIVGKMRPWNFLAGARIVTEGEVGDKLYIIERGVCDVMKFIDDIDMVVCQIGKEDFFGELAVMYEVPRSASVVAASGCTVLSLSREDLHCCIGSDKIEKMRIVARTQMFSGIPLLHKLSQKQKVCVAEMLRVDTWKSGDVLARQGARVNADTRRMYIIEKGMCRLEQHFDVEQRKVVRCQSLDAASAAATGSTSIIRAGQYAGMLGLLYGAPFPAHVIAETAEVKTLSISYDQLLHACDCIGEHNEMLVTIRKSMRAYLLRKVPQLKNMSEEAILGVLDQTEERRYRRWEVIFEKDQPLESIFILEEGSLLEHEGALEALKDSDLKEADCHERVTPGEFFGTRGVKTKGAVAGFTLVAITDCVVLKVPSAVLRSMLRKTGTRISEVDFASCKL